MKPILAVFLCLFATTGSAASISPSCVPADLLFSGKPIDPLCFSNPDNKSNLIHLNDCGAGKEKVVAKGQSEDLVK